MEDLGFKIEKNIPMPVIVPRSKYPFKDMLPGDSVIIPGKKPSNVHGTLKYLLPMKFICRTVDRGVRVWRIS